MDAKLFLAEFGHIANAPDGIQKLRELVTVMAITGKLTANDNPHASADRLEKKLKAIYTKKIAEKELKKIRGTKDISEMAKVVSIPKRWKWCSLELLAYPQAGFAFKSSLFNDSGSGLPIIRIRDVGEPSSNTYYSGEYRKEFLVNPGDYLISMDGEFRVRLWEGPKSLLNQRVTRLLFHGNVEEKYIVIALSFYLKSLHGSKSYTTVDHLSGKQIAEAPIPLPPLEEQSYIVDKFDELMSLCDKLEEQQKQKIQLQNQLRQTMLRALADASSPFEIKQHWQRLRDNFSSLFSFAEDTIDLSDHIKELAVKGLLCRSDSNVADLELAHSHRTELLNCYLEKKLMRKQKSISVSESDVEYPTNWRVVAFDEIALVTGGVTKGRKLKDRELISCPYLAVANVQRGFFNLTNLKTIDIPVDEIEKYAVQPGDLLITEGGDWDKVGRTAIWRSNIDNCLHQNHVFKVRVPSSEVLNEWVELVFNSVIGRSYFAGASKQTTNLASINMTQLRSFPFPVPPLSQQIEIINIVGALDKLCSVWKEKYERLNDLSSLFVKESIATLTGVDTAKKEEPLKVPKTELVSPITLGVNKPRGRDDAPLATLLARQNSQMNANDLWQRFGGEIDAFYAQLKVEVAHGWIAEPETANMLEKDEE